MVKFLSCAELYEAIQRVSSQTKELLWVSSVQVGSGAHKIFSQQIIKNPPADIRFVFPLNEATVKRGEINPYEIQYLKEHLKDDCVKANYRTYSNIYIFDNTAFLTSAALTENAFESNLEAGVMLDDAEVEKAKSFFIQNLWQNAKPIGDLKKQKTSWNLTQKLAAKNAKNLKVKPHTKLVECTDNAVNTWYIGVLNRLTSKALQKVRNETNWDRALLLAGDVGYKSFRDLKLGDLTYLADLNRQPGKVQIQLARVHDKARVETDEGDLHLACKVEKNYTLEREDFYGLLKGLGISSRSFEIKLSDEQLKSISIVLSTVKPKRKKSKKPKKAAKTKSQASKHVSS